jgi:hypothetical protein
LLPLNRALLFKLHSFKGALVSCTQFGIVEDLTARPVYMLDISRDYPHLLGNRGRVYSQTGRNEECSQHREISQAWHNPIYVRLGAVST